MVLRSPTRFNSARQDSGGLGGAAEDDGGRSTSGGTVDASKPYQPNAGATPHQPTGSSSWAAGYYDRASIVQWYYTSEGGEPIPLGERLQRFRNQYAQTGDAGLDDYVLDYQLRLGGSPEPDLAQPREPYQLGPREPGARPRKTKSYTVAALLEYLRKASPEEVAKFQALLREAGYMHPDVYDKPALLQSGVYDAYTQEAWTRLLKDAVMAGDTDVMRTIDRRKNHIDDAGGLEAWMGMTGGGQERAPFSPVLTSAEDIEAVGMDVAKDLTGRRQEGFTEELVGEYQGEEMASQRSQYDAAEAGGTTVAPPSLQTFAENELRERAAPEVGAYAGLGAFNVILQDLGMAG